MSREKINHQDVQALFRGFDKRWPLGRFYYCRYESPRAGTDLFNKIGTLTSFTDLDSYPDVAVNAALTFPGLEKLGLNPDVLQSFPGDFRQGMAARANHNGDINGSGPESWEEIWRDGEQVYLWLGVYARSEEALDTWNDDLNEWLAKRNGVPNKRKQVLGQGSTSKPDITVLATQNVRRFWSDNEIKMHIDDESTNPKKPVVLEHFGFRDGVSQPIIDGLDKQPPDHLRGGGKLIPDGSWAPLAPGEFLFGYVDVMGELPVAPVPPALAKNGSFMVQRKLEQDVDGFRSYLSEKAKQISSNSKATVKADYLAAKMIGRERDGTPLADADTLNNFRYSEDLAGKKCPLGAHMRRANPRDALGMNAEVCEVNGSTLVDRHRILRRAITYGNPVPTNVPQKEENPEGQGLMFMTLQTSITRQFEFVQSQWMNFGNDLNQANDRDPLVGNQTGHGRMAIPGSAETPTIICSELPQFVTTKGGDYFFLPGVSAFNRLAAGRFVAVNRTN